MSNLFSFFDECAEAGCVVVPVRVYSSWDEREANPNDFVMMFYAFQYNSDSVGPDYYIELEENHEGINGLCDTPEAALAEFQNWIASIHASRRC